MACTVTTQLDREAQIFLFDGALDTEAAQEIGPRVKESFLAGARKIVFDLSKVPYVSSMGLGIFAKTIQTFPGKVIFAAAQPYVLTTIKLAAFDKIATLAKTVEEALAM